MHVTCTKIKKISKESFVILLIETVVFVIVCYKKHLKERKNKRKKEGRKEGKKEGRKESK
jgi:ribosomal protein L19E